MKFNEKEIQGVFEIILSPYKDDRGHFMEVFNSKIYESHGIINTWVRENHSKSENKGTIRGLHFQLPPYNEAKLVRVLSGSIIDIFVDLRYKSKTFGQWDSIILSSQNNKLIYIPRGFAHGFCTLEDNTEVVYKVDNYYKPSYESGIIWNDNYLKIDWPHTNPILSERF